MEREMEIAKYKRGAETLEGIIKMKDKAYGDLLDSLQPKGGKKDKKNE